MDQQPQKSPPQTRRALQKRKDRLCSKADNQTAVAPTVTDALAKAKSEINMYKLKVQNLEEKVEALTKERDFLRTQLSESLQQNKLVQQDSDSSKDQTNRQLSHYDSESELDSESNSSESSSESDTSDSSMERKKKKKKRMLKKHKGKKARKQKKPRKESKCHYRQRVSEPADVVRRYRAVLSTYKKGKTMSEAFQKCGVDRNTIVQTAAIAELAIVAPEKYSELLQQQKGGKLSDLAKRCQEAAEADEAASNTIKQMKVDKELLPIRKQ